ncbi:hypothetical protein PHMEG_00017607 [Phytophthora megakarya]|uniref:Serine protease n=1 Tax=Phytophthora megakarya TaxID=4795 RepID=A0A225VW65_9STRA|nr:hypothetical protein PHMEG_00017607 [Phytophthora megakarya]
MQFHLIITLVAAVIQGTGASKAKTLRLNGWYPCADNTFSDAGSSNSVSAECAIYVAPLCYPGICKTPQFADPNVNIFVKRMLATKGDTMTATNVWLLQGGPGDVEGSMIALHTELKGAANIYTMDHRGTGRSTFLDCVAAQATTTGSPDGSIIKPSEVPACAQALENEYGDLASFSVTSAATDVVTFISKFTNGASTVVYGTSYGTVLVERIIHLNPPEVTGYILDGVATASGASADKFYYISEWDANFGEVGDYFLSLCNKVSSCNAHFKKPTTLQKTLQKVLKSFDKHPNSTCAAIISNIEVSLPKPTPSTKLRYMLGQMLPDQDLRKFIPPVVYRLNCCDKNDIEVLTQFINGLAQTLSTPAQEEAFYSFLLYSLVVFSEMWETPQPSMSVMKSRFNSYGISYGTYWMQPLYCAFSKEKSPACDKLGYDDYAANGIIYERDEYWNKSATIPKQASVLILSSKLDAQTNHKYAEYLLEALDGNKKELVTFEYSVHGALMSTQVTSDDHSSPTCGAKIVASYVSNNGDLKALDKSCVDDMPALNLTIAESDRIYYMSTDDAYDGVYDINLSASPETSMSASA